MLSRTSDIARFSLGGAIVGGLIAGIIGSLVVGALRIADITSLNALDGALYAGAAGAGAAAILAAFYALVKQEDISRLVDEMEAVSQHPKRESSFHSHPEPSSARRTERADYAVVRSTLQSLMF